MKKIQDLTLNIVKSLEVEVKEVSVRIMTSEQHSYHEEVPTFLVRAREIMLKKNNLNLKKSQAQQEFSGISIVGNLLNEKIFTIGEVSAHLMREVVIRESIEFDKKISESEFEEIDENLCPWVYPPVNHPNTLMLWKGYQDDPIALRVSGKFRKRIDISAHVNPIEFIFNTS